MRSTVSRAKARASLLGELEEAMRRSSAQGVLYGQAVANVAGIANSDLECMDILYLEGRVTAGRLAEVTGLTTGAITGVVDRLEKAGLVRRERDETDRRKVFIAVVPETRCHTPSGPCGDGRTNVIEVSLQLVMLRVAPSKGAPQLVPRSARKR